MIGLLEEPSEVACSGDGTAPKLSLAVTAALAPTLPGVQLCQPDQEGEWPPIRPKIENNALIVLPGARVADAVSAGAWGAFLHQGQICMTSGRHLVHESLHAEYVAALADRADKLPVGDPAAGPVALGLIIDAGREFRPLARR
ncbi:aldehyde dehydrogenase family protein [Actinomadura citrea]|uniref:Aldehyde dehydrogenase domain-containing protein n=1 Tax=Actinomadura citrea TaxID=46158 RepID=A0A7Y9KBU4_9ACTN|nr:aldehyde dehydrogenase family protein [Actinomadura citrea]NYE13327.1 hypothetical protein [Actinomadura citrea]